MFMTPRMPAASDRFATVPRPPASSVLAVSMRLSPSVQAHQGGSQRGTMGRSEDSVHRQPYTDEAKHTASHPGLVRGDFLPSATFHADPSARRAPVATMPAPAHDAYHGYYEPRRTLTVHDLPHRLMDRRERRGVGRQSASPYARPRDARHHATYATSPSPTHHERDGYTYGYADRQPPPLDQTYRDHHDTTSMPPTTYGYPHEDHNRSSEAIGFYEDAARHSHYAASLVDAPNLSPHARVDHTTYETGVDEWRDHRSQVISSPHARWTSYLSPATTTPVSPLDHPPLPAATATSARVPDAVSPRSPPSHLVTPTAPLLAPDVTLVGQLCAKRNCYREACPLYGDFCEFHKPSRLCKVPECRKCAKTGGYCIAHGGGRRCQADGCTKSAKEGGRCISHGGGKRCHAAGCDKAATAGGLCHAHA